LKGPRKSAGNNKANEVKRIAPKKSDFKKVALRPRGQAHSLIKNLKVASLHTDDITDIMLHCATALNVRKAKRNTPSGSVCYWKAADSTDAVIMQNGYVLERTTEADAQARGIPRC
jgi:hypothetical protein